MSFGEVVIAAKIVLTVLLKYKKGMILTFALISPFFAYSGFPARDFAAIMLAFSICDVQSKYAG